jgi:hypothetical protein
MEIYFFLFKFVYSRESRKNILYFAGLHGRTVTTEE